MIIKIGALGDVLRTTPLLVPLKKKYPESQITWLTDAGAFPLLKNNECIDRLMAFSPEIEAQLRAESFDLIINLDKAPWAAALAVTLEGRKRIGFGLHPCGVVRPLNKEAEYAFRLGVDDDLKFRKNQKSYQAIITEACGFRYRGEEYMLSGYEASPALLRQKHLDDLAGPVIGLNTGSGSIFAGKGWTRDGWLALVMRVQTELRATCLLLGGERERELNSYLAEQSSSPSLIDTGCDNSLADFISIVNLCGLVVCGDTLGMHIAIGLRKKVVALFGSTCPGEIDLYGRGVKVTAPDLTCAPCYRGTCDKGEICLGGITVDAVFNAIKTLLSA
jgi:heptosyltransferase-2